MKPYLLFLLCIALSGCPGAATQSPEACFAPRLAVINTRCADELVAACKDFPDVASCPHAPAIDERCDREIEAEKERCSDGAR